MKSRLTLVQSPDTAAIKDLPIFTLCFGLELSCPYFSFPVLLCEKTVLTARTTSISHCIEPEWGKKKKVHFSFNKIGYHHLRDEAGRTHIAMRYLKVLSLCLIKEKVGGWLAF